MTENNNLKQLLKDNFKEDKNILEASVTRKVKKFFEDKPGVWFFKAHGGAMSQTGIPDIIACVWGFFVAIELKRQTGKLTKIQAFTIKQIKTNGRGIAMTGYGYMDFENQFTKIYDLCEQKYSFLMSHFKED